MNRVRDLLSLAAYLAAKGVGDDPPRGLAEKFATMIDIMRDAVTTAMMQILRAEKTARAKAKPSPIVRRHRRKP